MCMSWNKQLSIGNTIVDSEHKHLISLVNQVEKAMRIAQGQRDPHPLEKAFGQLEDELVRHFRNEERIAEAIGYEFAQHHKTEEHMLTELHYLKSELMARDCIWTDVALEHFSAFLEEWMLDHILKADMPMKPTLESYGYNYWPAWERGGRQAQRAQSNTDAGQSRSYAHA